MSVRREQGPWFGLYNISVAGLPALWVGLVAATRALFSDGPSRRCFAPGPLRVLAQLEEQFELAVNVVSDQLSGTGGSWSLKFPKGGSAHLYAVPSLRGATLQWAVERPPHCGLSPLASELSAVLGSLTFDSGSLSGL